MFDDDCFVNFSNQNNNLKKNINYNLDIIGKDGLHPGPAIHYSYFTFFKNIYSLINPE